MDGSELPLTLTATQAEEIIRKHLSDHTQSTVHHITELKNQGYSYTSKTRTYVVDISTTPVSATPCSCFITIAHPLPSAPQPIGTLSNSLLTTHHIISLIHSQTDIPIPLPTLDATLSLPSVPYHFLLSPASPIASHAILSVTEARRRGLLNHESKEALMLELQIGRFLGRLHANVQNDYFGRIRRKDAQDTEVESYSWQETFTALLEALLWEAQSAGLDLPYEEIRSYLSRAISSFLFDDVDVPSLIWLTGSEEDVYIALPSSLLPPPPATFSSSPSTVPTLTTAGGIAAILPNVTHAVWGDPLLETFFLPPAPSPVLKEAYTKSGGNDTLVFPRQRTKRMWYDLLLGLIVLRERDGFGASTLEGEAGAQDEDRQRLIKWALDLIRYTITTLSTAPTY